MKTVAELGQALKTGESIETVLVDIVNGGQAHYLKYFLSNLILEYVTYHEIIHESNYKKIIKQDKKLQEITAYIKRTLFDATHWIHSSEEDIAKRIETLINYRDDLSKNVAVIAGYDDRLKMHKYVLKRRMSSQREKHFENISEEDFTGELLQFIFEFEDTITINDRVKLVYSNLPIRMSKIKLREWVDKALLGMKGINIRDFDNYMIYLKETYHPEGIEFYGEVLEEVFEGIQLFELLYEDILSEDDVMSLDKRISAIETDLESCVSLYTYTASMINNMLGVLSVLSDKSKEAEAEAIERFVTVMNSVKSQEDQENIMNDTIIKEFNAISVYFDDNRIENGKFDSLFENSKQSYIDSIISLGLDKVYDRLATLYILQSSSFFAPLRMTMDDFDVVTEIKLIEYKNDLINYIEAVSASETRYAKRTRIANLLSVINVVHKNPQEIHTYILNALVQCKDNKERNSSKLILNDIMVEE